MSPSSLYVPSSLCNHCSFSLSTDPDFGVSHLHFSQVSTQKICSAPSDELTLLLPCLFSLFQIIQLALVLTCEKMKDHAAEVCIEKQRIQLIMVVAFFAATRDSGGSSAVEYLFLSAKQPS